MPSIAAKTSLPRTSIPTQTQTKDPKKTTKKSTGDGDNSSSTQLIKQPKLKKLVVGRIDAGKKRGSGDGKEALQAEGDEAAVEALIEKLREAERGQKALRRASGGEALEGNRLGPDVVYDYTERTPIALWGTEDPLVDYAELMAKESTDVIPISPRPEAEVPKEEKSTTMLFQQQPKSPAMTWNANLTELEENEFAAEATFINDGFKLAYCLPREEENIYKNDIQHVHQYNPDGTMDEKDRVRIALTETPTTYYIQVRGRALPDDGSEDTEKAKLRNEKYKKVCQHHLESDAYYDRPTQTFLDRERDKSTQLVGTGVIDESQNVNNFMILDEWAALKESDAKRKLKEEEDAIMKSLTEQAQDDVDKNVYKGSSDEEDSDDDDRQLAVSNVDWNKVDEYFDEDDVEPPDEVNDEDIAISEEDEFDTELLLDEIYAKRHRALRKHRPKVLPDISYSALVLERIASTIRFQRQHMDIRGFHPLIKKDDNRRLHYAARNNALLDLGPKLKRFWSFKPNVTKGKEVTCIAPHPTNGNLIAASYGLCDYSSPPEGFVCIWNIKNINYPERVWNFESSVTKIAFSNLTPYLLAIGLLDGNIFVYDMRSEKPRAFCSTITSVDKHFGPVWDLVWLQETEKASSGAVNEVLISLSDDGLSYKWGASKGFEPWVLLKARRCPIKIPGRREKRAEALISQLSAAFTICFYPEDETLYLIGTEEGFIHKCTTSIAEQFICTYVSHTGPIYRIQFSPFAKDIFASCGGDWCIKIWKEDQASPLMTLWSDLRSVFDLMWCPHMSAVFVCASEAYIEVWDLKSSPNEPIIQFHPPGLGLRSVAYSEYLQALIIGDDDGGMTVFTFKNFPVQPRSNDEQADQLYEAIIPGYTRRKTKKTREDRAKSFLKRTPASPNKSLLHAPGHEERERKASKVEGDADRSFGSIKPQGSGDVRMTLPSLGLPQPAEQ